MRRSRCADPDVPTLSSPIRSRHPRPGSPDSVLELLAITRGSVEMFDRLQNELLCKLEAHALLRE